MKPEAEGRLVLFLTVLALVHVKGTLGNGAADSHLRNSKHFSLFSVVTFKNEECNSESGFTGGITTGTCFTATECGDKGGTKSGNCASGFGVCCIFVKLDASTAISITENRTYWRNPAYPDVETTAAGTTMTTTIQKMQSDICQVRLDFQNFVIAGPANTLENIATGAAAKGTNCNDQLEFTLSGGFFVPLLCGIMTDEHLYLDMGMDSTDTAVLSLTLAAATVVPTATAMRVWSIRTAQIPCWASYRAPEGCHRYMMQLSGQIISPNFRRESPALAANQGANVLNAGQDLGNQHIKTCIRRELGMCCTLFQVCAQYAGIDLTEGNTNGADDDLALNRVSEGWSFQTRMSGSLFNCAAAPCTATSNDVGLVDASCTVDYVEIPDSTTGVRNLGAAVQVNTRYCGVRFGAVVPFSTTGALDHAPVYDCTEPWEVTYQSDNVNDIGANADNGVTTPAQRGFCLDFTQEAC